MAQKIQEDTGDFAPVSLKTLDTQRFETGDIGDIGYLYMYIMKQGISQVKEFFGCMFFTLAIFLKKPISPVSPVSKALLTWVSSDTGEKAPVSSRIFFMVSYITKPNITPRMVKIYSIDALTIKKITACQAFGHAKTKRI